MFETFNKKGRATIGNEDLLKELMEKGKYTKLADHIGKKKKILGFYISNKGRYGKSVSVLSDDCIIGMPKRCVEQFEALTDEEVAALMSGQMWLTNIESFSGENGKTTVFNVE